MSTGPAVAAGPADAPLPPGSAHVDDHTSPSLYQPLDSLTTRPLHFLLKVSVRQRLAKHVATLALAVMTIVMTHCQLTPSAEHHCPFQDKSSNDSPEAASAAVVTHLLHGSRADSKAASAATLRLADKVLLLENPTAAHRKPRGGSSRWIKGRAAKSLYGAGVAKHMCARSRDGDCYHSRRLFYEQLVELFT